MPNNVPSQPAYQPLIDFNHKHYCTTDNWNVTYQTSTDVETVLSNEAALDKHCYECVNNKFEA